MSINYYVMTYIYVYIVMLLCQQEKTRFLSEETSLKNRYGCRNPIAKYVTNMLIIHTLP